MLALLAQADGWVPAGELATRLGVSTRSVRSYVTAVKAAADPLEVISSSTIGYRLNRDAYGSYLSRSPSSTSTSSPRGRVTHLVTRLMEADRVDVHEAAASLFVSVSTIEADLRRVRTLAQEAGLELGRTGSTVSISGAEVGYRRLISRMFREESAQGAFDLSEVQAAFGIGDLRAFKTDLIDLLVGAGYAVNEYGIDSALVHVAIAIDRSQRAMAPDRDAPEAPASADELVDALGDLVRRHFDTRLPRDELLSLAVLMSTRVATRAVNGASTALAADGMASELEVMRRLVRRAQQEYLVDLDDEPFLLRLTMHVRNLAARARAQTATHNPLARSIKTSYPLTYELAVFLASEIQRELGIAVSEDEIAFIALHVGSSLERRTTSEAVSFTLVTPGYHDVAELLQSRISAAMGNDLTLDQVIIRTDIDWDRLGSDLIVTTIDRPEHREGVVVVQPFFTGQDRVNLAAAAGRVRRHRRRNRIKEELLLYFDESLFFRNASASDEESMIRLLGAGMTAAGAIDESYIDEAIRREKLSSTAFTETLAVPHAMAMTASRTAIAVAVNDTAVPWGENRVNVIALVAFSESGRAAFQTVFEQFVEVFSEPADVHQLVRNSVDFGSFIEELVHLIDA